MLPKPNRLVKKGDFEHVFAGGKNIKSGFLAGRALKNNLPASRFGFVVSKKVSTKAAARNKIRRRLQSLASKEVKNISQPCDVVIIALPGTDKKEFAEIKTEVARFFKKI